MSDVVSVLIVDDSAVQRQHTAALCRSLGVATIHQAGNGEDALNQLSQFAAAPALLVIDLEMPVMDGVELIQKLRQRELHIPFIVASSREDALVGAVEVMARALNLPVLAGVRKPLTQAVLANAFERSRRVTARPLAERPQALPAIDPALLARALARGDVVPHYQPKVDIRTGLLRGVEVLARWTHRTLGVITPDRFIAAAEQAGHIHALTLSILDQAVAQAARWNARGLKLSLAVNLSPRLLDNDRLVEEVCTVLDRHGVAATQVVLEITEGSVVTTNGAALGVLARLRMRGFGLSIDDYGTGFSSMQQLARVPFTELKIDRSFVHGAHRQDNLRVILQSALDMARRLGLVTVAEGIETAEDWRLLQQFGCSVGQGWLIGKAMPAPDLLPWLRSHEPRLAELRSSVAPAEQPMPSA
jgi:EAL domain-containing protein (putative c-di-GMP-specific phosphodiesterase class I)/FixJ family two-component response regulator